MTSATQQQRHILGLSGGRDSAALAVFMRQTRPHLNVEYYFTDTGKELPEVYDFLDRLEGYLGRGIARLNPDRDFDFWLKEYGNFLPSARSRWCTRQLKLRPLERWIRPSLDAGCVVHSYVAIRADEPAREGYQASHPNLHVRFPLREAGIDRGGVIDILRDADVGEPAYYAWRSRSGCTFCFFQQKVEWVRLLERHPEAFAEAKAYEKTARDAGAPFTWSQGESLEELAQPERMQRIVIDHEKRLKRWLERQPRNPLASIGAPPDDELYGPAAESACLVCHK